MQAPLYPAVSDAPAPPKAKRARPGIVQRHSRSCPSRNGGKCGGKCPFEGWVWDPKSKRKISQRFPTAKAAVEWHDETQTSVRRGTRRASEPTTLRVAVVEWLEQAEAGVIKTRSGDTYKPGALRSYRAALELRCIPQFGAHRVGAISLLDFQDWVDTLVAEGLDPSTVRNMIVPVRSIYRRLLRRGEVAVNPTAGLELPAVRGTRDRIATPSEARQLLAALEGADRAMWSTAVFAGVRVGELQGLMWRDLAASAITVARSWDRKTHQLVTPKSRAGVRAIPLVAELKATLLEYRMACPWSGDVDGLVFGESATQPFDYWRRVEAAKAAWSAAELAPIGFHECRHTFASIMIAAGVNAKSLSTYMGHSSITITLDRYGHLFPGNENEAVTLVDAFLAQS